ncbi:MAG: hypothetical protein ACUVQ3_02690 [bacterium]
MDYTLVYFSIVFFILSLILDEVFAKLKMPAYFKTIIKLHSVDWTLLNPHYTLPPFTGLQEILRSKIKNKIDFYKFSQKEIFFKEIQYDYSVSRYSVVPIHGAIELVNPQKIRITVCLNLAIAGIFFLILSIFVVLYSFNIVLWLVIFFFVISGGWYYYRINSRIKLLVNSLKEWLGT